MKRFFVFLVTIICLLTSLGLTAFASASDSLEFEGESTLTVTDDTEDPGDTENSGSDAQTPDDRDGGEWWIFAIVIAAVAMAAVLGEQIIVKSVKKSMNKSRDKALEKLHEEAEKESVDESQDEL